MSIKRATVRVGFSPPFYAHTTMPNDRRIRIAGANYVFTTNRLNRRSEAVASEIGVPREAVRETQRVQPFRRSSGQTKQWWT